MAFKPSAGVLFVAMLLLLEVSALASSLPVPEGPKPPHKYGACPTPAIRRLLDHTLTDPERQELREQFSKLSRRKAIKCLCKSIPEFYPSPPMADRVLNAALKGLKGTDAGGPATCN